VVKAEKCRKELIKVIEEQNVPEEEKGTSVNKVALVGALLKYLYEAFPKDYLLIHSNDDSGYYSQKLTAASNSGRESAYEYFIRYAFSQIFKTTIEGEPKEIMEQIIPLDAAIVLKKIKEFLAQY